MELIEKLRSLKNGCDKNKIITICGAVGLVLIMLSSLIPDKPKKKQNEKKITADASAYCVEMEKRIEEFLEKIDGAGEVQVILTVGTDERYIYATENHRTKAENRTEEDEKYVIIGNGNDKNALVETMGRPEIIGVAAACSGCGSPVVQERIYKALSAVLGLETSRIYVTKLG